MVYLGHSFQIDAFQIDAFQVDAFQQRPGTRASQFRPHRRWVKGWGYVSEELYKYVGEERWQ